MDDDDSVYSLFSETCQEFLSTLSGICVCVCVCVVCVVCVCVCVCARAYISQARLSCEDLKGAQRVLKLDAQVNGRNSQTSAASCICHRKSLQRVLATKFCLVSAKNKLRRQTAGVGADRGGWGRRCGAHTILRRSVGPLVAAAQARRVRRCHVHRCEPRAQLCTRSCS